jgi:hypothetical protein
VKRDIQNTSRHRIFNLIQTLPLPEYRSSEPYGFLINVNEKMKSCDLFSNKTNFNFRSVTWRIN